MIAGLVLGERAGGESDDGAWFGTLHGSAVVVKRVGLDARPRFESLAAVLDLLRVRGVPTPAYLLIEEDEEQLVTVQSLLPGAVPVGPTEVLVDDVHATSELLADVPGVPSIRGVRWPALLEHSLTVGEDGWCRHEPMRTCSARTRTLLEHVESHGAAVDVASVPSADVVHLDLHPANLLADGGRLSGIVDWDAAIPGDRWFDLVYFAHHVDVWREDACATRRLWAAAEATVPAALLGAYAAHIALRTVEWQVSRHTTADVERWLAPAERLVARYP